MADVGGKEITNLSHSNAIGINQNPRFLLMDAQLVAFENMFDVIFRTLHFTGLNIIEQY